MILICEEWCYRHHLASDTERGAARERFNLAVAAAAAREDGRGLAVQEIFLTAKPLKWGIQCGEKVPKEITAIVHVHEADDSTWTDLPQQ